MRLDKYISTTTTLSRAEAKKIIKKGILINNILVKSPDYKVDEISDQVIVNGERLVYQEYIYIMMNKPGNIISATEDKKDTTNVFGQENNKVENNENKLNVVKTNSTPTPQNVEQNTKASLAKTGLSSAATAGLGALLLLSALVLRRKSNK